MTADGIEAAGVGGTDGIEVAGAHNVPTLSRLTRPDEGENQLGVTGQRRVAQGCIVTV